MSTTVLICTCGKRWNAPGAVPGRVGKCPSCGALLRVAEPEPEPAVHKASGYDLLPNSAPASSYAATPHRAPATSTRTQVAPPVRDGLLSPPKTLESSIFASLAYPLWGSSGIAILVFITPALAMTALPAITMLAILMGGTAFAVPGLILLIPASLGLLAVLSYLMIFLGRVLVSSTIGEIQQPRMPGWDLDEALSELGRWFVAVVAGGVIGGLPMLAYWIKCGDIDLFDRIVLIELAAVASSYAQMALLAAIVNESPWAANPITVFQAMRRVGWAWWKPCVFMGFAVMLAFTLLMGSFQAKDDATAFLLFCLACVISVYESMVVMRVLGLFHLKHEKALGWHRRRPRWR